MDYENIEKILKEFKEKHLKNHDLEQTIDLHLLGLNKPITCELTESYRDDLLKIPGVVYATATDGKGLLRIKVDDACVEELLEEK